MFEALPAGWKRLFTIGDWDFQLDCNRVGNFHFGMETLIYHRGLTLPTRLQACWKLGLRVGSAQLLSRLITMTLLVFKCECETENTFFTVMGKRELLPLAIEWFRSASSRHQASTPCVHGRLLD